MTASGMGMTIVFLLFSLFFSSVSCRVALRASEVIDSVDLRGVNSVPFRCSFGCRVYSPTRTADIVIVDGNGKELKSLLDLSILNTPNVFELPASTSYSIKNKGLPNPNFVFYSVERTSTNFNAIVMYADPSYSTEIKAHSASNKIFTILSSTGFIRISNFLGDYKNGDPPVYATGADALTDMTCDAIYRTRTGKDSIYTANVPINGPIATIFMLSTGPSNSFTISGNPNGVTVLAPFAPAVILSPGYVGCNSTKNSLYSLVATRQIDTSFTQTDKDGVRMVVSGVVSIGKAEDGVRLTVNNKLTILYGEKTVREIVSSPSFNVDVFYPSKEGTTDRFALQFDFSKSDKLPTTTKLANPLSILMGVIVMLLGL